MSKKKSIQLINSIKKIIFEKKIFLSNNCLLLGISGGQDSIFLLISIYIIKSQCNLHLNIIYCNHLWQKTILYNYLEIIKISYCLNINSFYSISLNFLKSEENSRYWRSNNFYRVMRFSNSIRMITGHTLTDHIETFFFNTIRGSSIKGSFSLKLKKSFFDLKEKNFFISESELLIFCDLKQKKIYILKNLNIVFFKKKIFLIRKKKQLFKIGRPLLTKTRFDIKNFCNVLKLSIIPDQSNNEIQYSRNRFRKQIVPIFRFFFNPKVDLSLYRHNNLLIEEEEFLSNLINQLLTNLIFENQKIFFLDLQFFSGLNFSLQRKICLLFFKEKLKVNYKFVVINSFLILCYKLIRITKKNKKLTRKISIFLPEIGTIYFSQTVFIFFK